MSMPALSRRLLLLGSATLLAAFAPRHIKPKAQPAVPAAPPTPGQTPLGPLDTVAKQACIIDFETRTTLLDKEADARMTPSSLTKLMTAYLVFSALAAGRITLTTEFPVSEKAWRMGGSKMFVPYPGSVAVADLIRGMIIQSGNDACIVLAEGISGSEDQFVARMNDEAGKFGLKNTHFVNCTGWPDPDHYSCARDITTIAWHLINDFPQYYHFFDEKSFTFDNIHQGNRNTLVDAGIADGLKTGHTEEGGYGECSSAKRNGRRVIVVLNGMDSMNQRAHETERLLEWGLDNFENVRFLHKGEVLDQVPVYLGTAPSVPLVGANDEVLTLPHGWRKSARIDVVYTAPVPAPVRRGQTLGSLRISGGALPTLDLDLLAGASVPQLPLGPRAMRVLSHYLTGA